ncbi:hypothetical protein EAO27_13480 [Sphingopyxis sp. YF1]|uniref:phage head morphogenesis protein n=1 Tax=Sphingopyxis sp. YF1 TaxID=2482763 RepID=UPI001F61CA48|nr:phage minor head protein [Sphingopyxis sp. YF1]UNU43620.1 hypothetical protein EAO27_13480 [Sphingopyxis sp. YF1]
MEIPFGLTPVEALAWFRAKGFVFGFSWQDVWHQEHGRGFTVAKAMTRDVLETIREAVDRAIAEGQTLDQFRKDLRPLLEKLGWWGKRRAIDPATGEIETVQLGSPRRLKTIFSTNMRTSYAAGRWERIQRNKRAFPLLEYVNPMDGREREQHHIWHGTVLPVDDDWWDEHYPPNDWECRCLPKPVSRGQAARRGLKITQPRVFPKRQWVNKRTGEIHMIEQGLGAGWAYHVGKARHDGLTPGPMNGDGIAAMSALSGSDEAAVSGFLAAFGMRTRDERIGGRTYVDAGNWPIAIAASWFRGDDGAGALPAGLDAAELDDVAAAIMAPAEIRWLWIVSKDVSPQLVRRYFGAPDQDGAVMVVDVARWWRAKRVPAARAAAMRRGALAWSPELGVAAYDPSQPRHPKGSRDGGRFRSTGRGAALVSLGSPGVPFFKTALLGKVGDGAADRAADAGIDIRGKGVRLEHRYAKHILKVHGAEGVTGRDIVNAQSHLNAATKFLPAKPGRGGAQRFEAIAGKRGAIFEQSKRNVALISLYPVWKSRGLDDD